MVKVQTADKISSEQKGELQQLVNNLSSYGYTNDAICQTMARRLRRPVSVTYQGDDCIFKVHTC